MKQVATHLLARYGQGLEGQGLEGLYDLCLMVSQMFESLFEVCQQ